MRSRWLAYLCVCLSLIFGTAWADGNRIQVDIAPKDLPAALDELAAQADLQMLFDRASVRDKKTPGLKGTYSRREAVDKLLAGSGLVYTFTADTAVAIKKPERVALDDTAEAAPKKAGSDEPVVLPEMTVTATPGQDTSYNVFDATTATKTDTPIFDTPASIQVIPKNFIDDKQSVRLYEALENVSGVVSSFNRDSLFYDSFIVRGFDTGRRLYIDGQRDLAHSRSLANIERVEVLKGPAAMLYGRLDPGGLINLVTKRPQHAPYYSFQQQFGSFDLYRTLIDATGPVTTDGSLLYRLNFEFFDSDSFTDFVNKRRFFVAPSLTWQITPRTQLDVDFRYKELDGSGGQGGVPAFGNRPAPIPISRNLSDPELDRSFSRHFFGGATLTHQFDDNWKGRVKFGTNDFLSRELGVFPITLDEATGIMERGYFVENPFTETSYLGTADLTGKFITGKLNHTFLVGFDYYRQSAHEDAIFLCRDCGTVGFPEPIDIFNPRYGISQVNLDLEQPNSLYFAIDEWYGFYIQDQIQFLEKWHLLLGGRYDWAFSSLSFNPGGTDPIEVHDEDFSPRVGLLYHPLPWLGVHANWTRALNQANTSRLEPGLTPAPERSEAYEFGLKGEWLEGKITASLVYYNLTKDNIARISPDPLLAAQGFNSLGGEGHSRGLELDLAGQLTEDWRVIATYAFTDTEFTKDPSGLPGRRFPNVPVHLGSIWSNYELTTLGPGLNIGLGAYFASERQGDRDHSFQLPGYARLDAALSYKWQLGPNTITLQFNVDNLLDKRYFTAAGFDGSTTGSRFNANPGAPRTFLGSVRVEF